MTDFTGDAGNNTISGTSGDDRIQGLEGNDILNGAGGNDILIGGPGADILTGGSGADTFRGTAAELNGDRITDFLIGDRIQFLDLTSVDAQTIHTEGNNLIFNGGSLQIDNIGPGRFVLREILGGGIELRLQAPAHNDFNGDGRSDILWRNDNGTVTDWLATKAGGFSANAGNFNITAPPSWQIIGTGDFNGDGMVDLLWRSTDGTVTNWLAKSNGGFADNWNAFNITAPSSWQVIGTGDYNGDGKADLMWRSTDGTITNWLATSNGSFTDNWNAFNIHTNDSWQIIGTGDYNGDGRSDLMWRGNDGTITNWLATENGGFTDNWNAFNIRTNDSWQIIGSGDFNGDGRTDLLWKGSDGTITNWLANANGGFNDNWNAFNVHTDGSWNIAQIGDFNGDSIDDLVWRGPNGEFTTWIGTASGGFTDNSANTWSTAMSNSWHLQPHESIV